jgi:hypothetical protein
LNLRLNGPREKEEKYGGREKPNKNAGATAKVSSEAVLRAPVSAELDIDEHN